MTSTTKSKTWVICWKPFNPAGNFIACVDFTNHRAVEGVRGLTNAMRFSKPEVAYYMDEIVNYMSTDRLLPVNLGDHYFDEV